MSGGWYGSIAGDDGEDDDREQDYCDDYDDDREQDYCDDYDDDRDGYERDPEDSGIERE